MFSRLSTSPITLFLIKVENQLIGSRMFRRSSPFINWHFIEQELRSAIADVVLVSNSCEKVYITPSSGNGRREMIAAPVREQELTETNVMIFTTLLTRILKENKDRPLSVSMIHSKLMAYRISHQRCVYISLNEGPNSSSIPLYLKHTQKRSLTMVVAEQLRQDRESRQHLLSPNKHFRGLEDLERKIIESCRLWELFNPQPVDDDVNDPHFVPNENLQDLWLRLRAEPRLNQPTIKVLQLIIERVLNCFHQLQEWEFCGHSFSIIVADVDRCGVVKAVPITSEVLVQLARLTKEATSERELSLEHLELVSEQTLAYLGFHLPEASSSRLQSTVELLLILSLGLVSYSGSHVSDFHGSKSPVCRFDIASSQYLPRRIVLGQERLACLDGFVGGPIWVFRLKQESSPHKETQALSTSLHDLADLWGPAWMVGDSPELIKHVIIERGIIYQPTSNDRTNRYSLRDGETACHWKAWEHSAGQTWATVPFRADAQLLIGANSKHTIFGVRKDCGVIGSRLYGRSYGRNEKFQMGTDRSRGELDSHMFNFQFSKVISIGYQVTFKRIPARTCKAMLLLEWCNEQPSPATLDTMTGVDISACTENASRSRLWEIFQLRGVQDFIRATMPDSLPSTDSSLPDFLLSISKGFDYFLQLWYSNNEFRQAARTIIRRVLMHMSCTGIDQDGLLRVWWADSSALRGFKIRFKEHKWIAMLRDTERAAAFTVLSESCIEYWGLQHIGSFCSSCGVEESSSGATVLRTAILPEQDFAKVKTKSATPFRSAQRLQRSNDEGEPVKAVGYQSKTNRPKLLFLQNELSEHCLSTMKRKNSKRPATEMNEQCRSRSNISSPDDNSASYSRPQTLAPSYPNCEIERSRLPDVHSTQGESSSNAMSRSVTQSEDPCRDVPAAPNSEFKARILEKGSKIQLPNKYKLEVINEDVPQCLKWTAANPIINLIERVGGDQGSLHREAFSSEDFDDEIAFHVVIA